MEGESITFQVVLPTQKGVPSLVAEQATPQIQFLVGYRNILSRKGDQIAWGLIKSKHHCGRAFTFPIEQLKALKIQQFKGDDEVIQVVGNNYIILKVEKDIIRPTEKLTTQVVRRLLEELGGVNKINLNILKCSFNSYEEYRSIIDVETQRQLDIQDLVKELQIGEKIEIEFKSKELSGKGLMLLPLISKETGKRHQQKSIQLKILEH